MIVKCKNCLPVDGIEIPDFSQSTKIELIGLTAQSSLQSIKFIVDNFNLSHRDAKYISTHINAIYGHCNRCNYDKLDEEYVQCPKCGALNFNWNTSNEKSKTHSP